MEKWLYFVCVMGQGNHHGNYCVVSEKLDTEEKFKEFREEVINDFEDIGFVDPVVTSLTPLHPVGEDFPNE